MYANMQQKYIAEIYETTQNLWKKADVQREANRLRLRDDVDVYYLVELFAADVSGYALSAVKGWWKRDSDEAVKHLRELSIFQNQEFYQWSENEGKNYPNFVDYVNLTDYLRLLVIDYLTQVST
jgi:hypothetical protein